MTEKLDLPLFELRRFVVVNDDVEVGINRSDFHLDLIIRMTGGRYSFVNDRQHQSENQTLLKRITDEEKIKIDMGTIIRTTASKHDSILEIEGQSETFSYPPHDDTLVLSQNRQNTLRIFQEKYPDETFVLV